MLSSSSPSSLGPSYIYIPIQDSSECVSVPLDSLPPDPHDLIDLLKLELAHPSLWLEFCRQYYKRGLSTEFQTILSVIISQEAQDAYRQKLGDQEFKVSRIEILNTLAAWETLQGIDYNGNNSADNSSIQREMKLSSAISHLNEASDIDLHQSITWMNKGYLLYYQGDYKGAENNFNNAIQSDKDKISNNNNANKGGGISILPIIGKALCCIATERYKDALRCFQSALREHPQGPVDVLLGYGYCYWRLGEIEKAGKCYGMIMKKCRDSHIDTGKDGGSNTRCYIESLLGISTMKMIQASELSKKIRDKRRLLLKTDGPSKEKAKSLKSLEDEEKTIGVQQQSLYKQSYDHVSEAYQCDSSHPGVLSLLSQHCFYRGEYSKGRVLGLRALDIINDDYNIIVGYNNSNNNADKDKSTDKDAKTSKKTDPSLLLDPPTRTLRIHILYEIGRSYHIEGDMLNAHIYYQQAKGMIPHMEEIVNGANTPGNTKTTPAKTPTPTHPPLPPLHCLLLFCLSQTHIHRREYTDAKLYLLYLSRQYPFDYHIHRIFASVLVELHDYQLAVKEFETAIHNQSQDTAMYTDSELQLEYAQTLQIAAIQQEEDSQERMSMLHNSYVAYKRVFSLLKSMNIPITSELYNNIGVLCHQLSRIQEAESYYILSIKSPTAILYTRQGNEDRPEEGRPLGAIDVSSLYNWGLLNERMNQNQHAKRIYKLIRYVYPKYIDATLRLGGMASMEGNDPLALSLLQDAHHMDSKNISVMTQLGVEYMKHNDYNQAAKQFMYIMKETTSLSTGDSYAKIALGNIQYLQGTDAARKASQLIQMQQQQSAQSSRKDKDKGATATKEQEKIQSLLSIAAEHFERAGKYFRSVLSSDPMNYLAANGLSLVLVSEGRYNEARDFFTSIRDARHDFDDVTINLGCIYVQQQQYMQGITLFSMILDKLKGNKKKDKEKDKEKDDTVTTVSMDKFDHETQQKLIRVEFYLAKTYYLSGLLVECQKTLKSLLRLQPYNVEYWYNLALSMEEMAISILQKSKNERKLDEVEDAVNQLTQAGKIFNRLQKMDIKQVAATAPPLHSTATSSSSSSSSSSSPSPFSSTTLQYIMIKSSTHYQFCTMSLTAATPHLNAARQREIDQNKWREQTLRARQEMEERIKHEEQMELKKKEDERQRADELARKAKEKLEVIQEEWITVEKDKDKEEKGGKEDKDFVVNDGDEDAQGYGGEGEYKEEGAKKGGKGKKGRPKKAKEEEGEEEGEEEREPTEGQDNEDSTKNGSPDADANDEDEGDEGELEALFNEPKQKQQEEQEDEITSSSRKRKSQPGEGDNNGNHANGEGEKKQEDHNGNEVNTTTATVRKGRIQRKTFDEDEEEGGQEPPVQDDHVEGGADSNTNNTKVPMKRRKIMADDDDEQEEGEVQQQQLTEESDPTQPPQEQQQEEQTTMDTTQG